MFAYYEPNVRRLCELLNETPEVLHARGYLFKFRCFWRLSLLGNGILKTMSSIADANYDVNQLIRRGYLVERNGRIETTLLGREVINKGESCK
ncbi:hypothetical protein [Beggiatoa leptomitoformis]|uniref:Uncharacterized protein n=1 Tax=Beggiatoa leptomitoformis TaxID=288004 RepID=A0A2N9YHZ0_9GAMM|nr:hypothetical protein [Beggiatoa leptomitoformis]ALG67899.1 hypothetical protein AL038_09475 [Beggiatoa leptomitoformis]AUI69836.1 hypothetical protein BLE401_14805 [Beggiatoa leptomitoformis]